MYSKMPLWLISVEQPVKMLWRGDVDVAAEDLFQPRQKGSDRLPAVWD